MTTNVRTFGPNQLGQSIHKPNRGTRQTVQGWAASYGAFSSVGSGGAPPVVTYHQLINRHGHTPGAPMGFVLP